MLYVYARVSASIYVYVCVNTNVNCVPVTLESAVDSWNSSGLGFPIHFILSYLSAANPQLSGRNLTGFSSNSSPPPPPPPLKIYSKPALVWSRMSSSFIFFRASFFLFFPNSEMKHIAAIFSAPCCCENKLLNLRPLDPSRRPNGVEKDPPFRASTSYIQPTPMSEI